MKFHRLRLFFPFLLLLGCVAKEEPIQRPPFPLSRNARIELDLSEVWNLAHNEALYQRATKSDFGKAPLVLTSDSDDPIPVGTVLIDPKSGHVLQDIEVLNGGWSVPLSWGKYKHAWYGYAPVDVHEGSVNSWLFTRNAAVKGSGITFVDSGGKGMQRAADPWPGAKYSDVDVQPTENGVVMWSASRLVLLAWEDGRILWQREDCPGDKTIGQGYILCSDPRAEAPRVKVVDLANGDMLLNLAVKHDGHVTVNYRMQQVAISTGRSLRGQRTSVYRFGGRLLHTMDGVVLSMAARRGTAVYVSRDAITAIRGRRESWVIPFSSTGALFHADITFPSDGQLLLHFYSQFGTGDGWTALIETETGKLLWAHETPALASGTSEYYRYSYTERRGPYIYVINQESAGQTIEVLDFNTGELLRIWAYDIRHDRE